MDQRVAAFVHYYAREGQVHHVQTVCNEVLKRRASPALQLWRAYGLMAGGAAAEALRELADLQLDPLAGAAAAAAALHAHKAAKHPDHAAIAALQPQLEAELATAEGEAALQLAALLSHTHSFEAARGVLERCLRAAPAAAPPPGADGGGAAAEQQLRLRLRSLLGWVVLSQQLEEALGERDAEEVAAAGACFDEVLAADGGDLEALLGKARVLEVQGRLQEAADLAGELGVRYPWFVPGLVERCRLLLAAGDWEGASAAAAQLLAADARNVLGLAVSALHALVREGDARAAAAHLTAMAAAVAREEPRNARMAFSLARPFARLVAPDAAMLGVTLGLAQRAAELAPTEAEYLAEVGHQKLLLEQLPAAAGHFEAALHLDPLCAAAAVGLAEALIGQGRLAEAEEQMQMLPDLLAASRPPPRRASASSACDLALMTVALPKGGAATSDNAATSDGDLPVVAGGGGGGGENVREDKMTDLVYLRGLIAWARGRRGDALLLLERAAQLQLAEAEDAAPGLEQLAAAAPARLLGVVRRLLGAQGADPRAAGEAPSPAVSKCIRILEALGRFTGQLPAAQLLYARALYLNGALDAAARKAADALRGDPGDAAPQLLLVSICVRQGRASEAMDALEAAVAVNFGIRDAPLYHVVHAQVLVANGRLEDAKKVLEAALAAPGVRAPLTPEQRDRLAKRGLEPSTYERAGVFLLLAEVHQKLWAARAGARAARQEPGGKGGGGGGGGAAQAVAAGESPEARKLLAEAVKEFAGSSEEVRVALADCEMAIARGDVEGVVARLQAVPVASPHYARARTALAGVHLRHRRDRAAYIRCYLDLVDKSPDYDSYCMLGDAGAGSAQEPEKAVRAFEAALALSPKDAGLALKCGAALVTAHDYGRAVDYYNRAVRNDPSKVSSQHALASLLIRLRQLPRAEAVLARCIEHVRARQDAVTERGGTEALATEADTLVLLAKLYAAAHEPAEFEAAQRRAIGCQRLLLDRLHAEGGGGGGGGVAVGAARDGLVGLWGALAEHYARTRQLEKAKEAHQEVLAAVPDHGPSLLALARIALAQGDVDGCQAQCVGLLRSEPDNEDAATMLAEIMFHQESPDSALFHFAQLLERRPRHYDALEELLGLLRRYRNDPRGALEHLNLARKDPAWAGRALTQMIEVYLNSEGDVTWGDGPDGAGAGGGGGAAGGGGDKGDDAAAAAESAQALLQQLRPEDVDPTKYQVLQAYTRMAGRAKGEVEGAVSELLDLAAADASNVPVLLALAHGFMLMNQVPKARNQLKRVAKLPYHPAEADAFERAWLALADIHVQGGKFDLAQDLCTRCLKHNKSCARAWELAGSIAEREQAYADAAWNYEAAWRLTGSTDPTVGYKLAFNYLKAGRLVDAAAAAMGVLKADPSYPSIRKDILDKARAGLRPSSSGGSGGGGGGGSGGGEGGGGGGTAGSAVASEVARLSPRQLEQLDTYLDYMLEVNQSMNLTAIRERGEAWARHVEDSLALLPAIEAHCAAAGRRGGGGGGGGGEAQFRVIDVGSGAGLPGMVLAIARPHWRVTLLDSLKKRCAFLEAAAACAGAANVSVVWARAEEGGRRRELRGRYDLAVARAVADTRVLAELCLPFVRRGGYWVAAKGAAPGAEAAAAARAVRLLGGGAVRIELVDSWAPEGQRTAVVVHKERPTPDLYPRLPGAPGRKPL
ncbi:MAG: intraflagellar transport protein [Monoraphidium minutum]|nr:MAG: intraflagellar transport protein [Monoraphidium minutum]